MVPLPSGRWHIVCERLRDTILQMLVDDVPSPTLLVAAGDGYELDGPCNVRVIFATRGSEDYISVRAERGP